MQLAMMICLSERWMPIPDRLFVWNREFSTRTRWTRLPSWSVPTRRSPSPKHSRTMQRSITRSSVPVSTSMPWDCSSGCVSPVRLPSTTRSLKATRRQLFLRMNTLQSPVGAVVSISLTTDPGPAPVTMKSWTPPRSSDHRPPGTVTRETRYVPGGKRMPPLPWATASSIATWIAARSSEVPLPDAPKSFTLFSIGNSLSEKGEDGAYK